MSQNTPETSPETSPESSDHGRVATGDRREEVHFEPDPDQLVKASHLVRPETPIPPEMHCPAQERGELPDDPAIFDVRVAPQEPSVWDARPVDEAGDDAGASGNPTGH